MRLWFLQVLQGEDYVKRAAANRERRIPIAAPRGTIVDRNGRTLVKNRIATSVVVDPSTIPPADRDAILQWGSDYGRWAAADPKGRGRQPPRPRPSAVLRRRERRYGDVLDLSTQRVRNRVIDELVQTPYAPIRLRQDVPATLRNFLAERETDYPGLSVQRRYPREYPDDGLAAQIFGTIGEVSPDELRTKRYRGLEQGQIVGKEGLEYEYDEDLRGRSGAERIQVDATGRPTGRPRSLAPAPGNQLRLTLDRKLQKRAESVLATAVKETGGPLNVVGDRRGRRRRGARSGRRLGAGHGLLPELRRERAHQADHQRALRRALRRAARRAAVQPRDRLETTRWARRSSRSPRSRR